MKIRYFLPVLTLFATCRVAAAQTPRLVVQIVVSSMRAEDLSRYADNFSDDGFLRLVRGGTFYPESHYDYLHTSTPVSLATLTTGANPSVHGIVAERWPEPSDSPSFRPCASKNSMRTLKANFAGLPGAVVDSSATVQ